jgi:putative NADPH-quinone reductase
MDKILIINANPKANSLCKAISERYQENISESKPTKILHIGELDFQLSLDMGYEKTMALEPSLIEF